MAGNTLGTRSRYLYVSDTGTTYTLRLDDDLAEAGGLTEGNNGVYPPPRFKPRVVLAQAEDAEGNLLRKRIPCAPTSGLLSDTPQVVEIDGVNFTTTGRVGEKASS
jgi:hypothetical protein